MSIPRLEIRGAFCGRELYRDAQVIYCGDGTQIILYAFPELGYSYIAHHDQNIGITWAVLWHEDKNA